MVERIKITSPRQKAKLSKWNAREHSRIPPEKHKTNANRTTWRKGDPRLDSKQQSQRGKRSAHPSGRKPAIVERVRRRVAALKDAILVACEEIGRDGKGKDGVVGWCKRLEKKDIKAFASLVAKVLPHEITASLELSIREIVYESEEQIAEKLREAGLPVIEVYRIPNFTKKRDMQVIDVDYTRVEDAAPEAVTEHDDA